jgi:hypothetical protein
MLKPEAIAPPPGQGRQGKVEIRKDPMKDRIPVEKIIFPGEEAAFVQTSDAKELVLWNDFHGDHHLSFVSCYDKRTHKELSRHNVRYIADILFSESGGVDGPPSG